jgi:K+ transporter
VHITELNKCYKIHTNPAKWKDAIKVCKAEQSCLVIVNSKTEANFLVKEMAKYPPENYSDTFDKNNFQAGFSDQLNHGVHRTIEGTRFETFEFLIVEVSYFR